jgi:hypothetical protein
MLNGNLSQLSGQLSGKYPNALYQLDWDTVPEVERDSVRNVVTQSTPEDWVFEGAKLADAPGWKDGSCDPDYEPQPFSAANLRAIGYGAQFADMVSLVAGAAGRAGARAELPAMHKAVLRAFGENYAAGRGAFKGRFENWSFFPDVRTLARQVPRARVREASGAASLPPARNRAAPGPAAGRPRGPPAARAAASPAGGWDA